MRYCEDRRRYSRLATCENKAANAPIQCSQPFLEHVIGRIHQPRIYVAEFLQREEIGGVFGVFENIAGGGIDRHRARHGRWIRFLSRMQSQGSQPISFSVIVHSFTHTFHPNNLPISTNAIEYIKKDP